VTAQLIEARGVQSGYEGVPVVHDLDITVGEGEIVALLGPNGAGKTTSIMTLAGEVSVLQGEVWLNGQPTKAPLHRRVMEDGLALITERRAVFMSLTVAENLRVTRGDADHALELFPLLGHHLKRRVSMLSGGQQQMLALACALSRRPRLLLADELSLGLAPIAVNSLLGSIRQAADSGLGVLLVEQHIHKALEVADRAYVMRRGRIVLTARADELRGRTDEIERAYLAGEEESQSPTVRRIREVEPSDYRRP
jgi:ABC-type branched-subunit amino acid transport system ATPase component